ncbi:hypothetical protein HMPREF3190_00438 [Umbribacter vaginalis]|nr:hypothetical protein HMPREF3190_00438 [Coriobacteriales bacterium DNF00809]
MSTSTYFVCTARLVCTAHTNSNAIRMHDARVQVHHAGVIRYVHDTHVS